jgi:sodium transport system permease protein
MNPKLFLTVFRKELTDSLRDKRTLISILLVPSLLFPVITFIAIAITAKVVSKAKSEIPSVMVIGGLDSPKALGLLQSQAKLQCKPASGDWKQLVSDKKVRAVVEIPPGFDASLERNESAELKIFHYEGEMRSGFAVGEISRVFTEYRDQLAQARLAGRGLPASLLRPFTITAQNVASPEKVGGNLIGGMIPYLFIIICFSSAMYPAIDLTAGEKERGTMETILCSPISRLELTIGKFLLVLVAGLTAVVCSLISMGVSMYIGGLLFASNIMGGGASAGGHSAAIAGQFLSFDPLGFVGIMVLVLPLAALFSAVLLAVSLYAKSTKEAQSLVTPLIVVIVIPAMMGLLPGVELNFKLALVPILNLALACKEMLSGVWHWPLLLLIFSSTCAYAAAALYLCVRQFNREDVIFRS